MNKLDLQAPGVSKQIARQLKADIDEYCVKSYGKAFNTRLGASIIGHSCSRYLWGIFRWLLPQQHEGRMLRLFNRGHREEERFIEWLRGIGCKVNAHDENGNQHYINSCGGHFGGAIDGEIELPERYGVPEIMLAEFKTQGSGSGFNKLTENGFKLEKPQHFAQASIYGKKRGRKHVAYLAINKNDDSLHIEVAKLDENLATQMEQKAERIITSDRPPARLSDNPTYKDCQYCEQKDVCHAGAIPARNCRSCAYAQPIDGGQWHCHNHNGTIPKEFIPQACDGYKAITQNV